ncbi:MAG TPA: NnrS family protein [Casimicrobiaceae bacterium]
MWRAPVWQSGFRPYFLLGAVYGPLALAAWLGAYLGAWRVPSNLLEPGLWHGHEMVFGFVVAIVSGLLLTALPSWAGVPEQNGGTLALLVAAWLAGRAAMWLAPLLPAAAVAAADIAALPLLCVALAPGLLRARQRKFAVVLPVLLALAGADAAFHAALGRGDSSGASTALTAAVGIVVVLYSLVGGFMTPVFTNNVLRERGSARRAWRNRRLDLAAHALAVAFAVTQAVPVSSRLAAGVAAAACVAHTIRLAGWRGWEARAAPLVAAMHAGYAWLVLAFGLAAAASLGLAGARDWLHAATIGAFGLMMLALMPRVSLRHTGRALALRPAMAATYVAMSGAALLRLAFDGLGGPAWAALAAGALWSACFVVYLGLHAPMLLRPSLPRDATPGSAIP